MFHKIRRMTGPFVRELNASTWSEPASTLNTGNVRNELTAEHPVMIFFGLIVLRLRRQNKPPVLNVIRRPP